MAYAVEAWERAKDPNEIVDYDLIWDLDEGDAIATSTWTVQNDGTLTVQTSTFLGNITKVWFAGGTVFPAGSPSNYHLILNRITTTGGRTLDCTARLKVRER